LDSTLVVIHQVKVAEEAEGFHVSLKGDGYYSWGDSERISLHRFSNKNNAPAYITYNMLPMRQERYLELPDSVFTVEQRRTGLDEWVTHFEGSPDDKHVRNGWAYFRPWYDIDWILGFSDGLGRFVDDQGNKIPDWDVFQKITEFKSLKGEFITRRMRSFEKECRRLGWTCEDDLFVTGISVLHT
jgi:hypothetical protein